ncbi:MAG: thiamine-phosphate kinase [bacterium]
MGERKPGEFELIARLAARLSPPGEAGVVGIGDDAAAIPVAGGFLLLTCDIAVEGRHFVRAHTPMADLGWKVASASVSDVVACGGLPTYALISLGIPDDCGAEPLERLYEGLEEAGTHYGFQVIGGNVTAADQLLVDCFMVGRAERFVSRSGSEPGQLLAVSGTLGDSDAGRELLGREPRGEGERALLACHLRPRVRTDTELVGFLRDWAGAAIDISDSLAAELHHLARAGGVGLQVEGGRIPISAELEAFCAARGEPALERALYGGEDYRVLCTLPAAREAEAQAAGFTVIGSVTAAGGVTCSGRPLPDRGWDHLQPRP